VGPEHRAGFFVESQNALGAVHRARLGLDIVEDEHPSVGDRGAGVPAVYGHPPLHFEAIVRKRAQDAGLRPDAEPLGAAPLRPVLGKKRRLGCYGGQHGSGAGKPGQPR